MNSTPRVIANYHCHTGEGPMWHAEEAALYWMDIPQGRLFRYDPATGEHAMVREGGTLGAATIQHDGGLVLMGGPGCCVSIWRNGVESDCVEMVAGETRFNDAIADATGRVYSGSMPQRWGTTEPAELGSLYRLDPDGSVHVMDRGFGCANGMAWSADGQTLYFIDSPSQNVYAYDADPATGDLSNRRVHFQTAPRGTDSVPDGMTIDADGCFWVARWGAGCVVRYDPTGVEMSRVALPTPCITSVTFGGPELKTMYITSAGGDRPEQNGPLAGGLFAVDLDGVRGVAEFRSRLTSGRSTRGTESAHKKCR